MPSLSGIGEQGVSREPPVGALEGAGKPPQVNLPDVGLSDVRTSALALPAAGGVGLIGTLGATLRCSRFGREEQSRSWEGLIRTKRRDDSRNGLWQARVSGPPEGVGCREEGEALMAREARCQRGLVLSVSATSTHAFGTPLFPDPFVVGSFTGDCLHRFLWRKRLLQRKWRSVPHMKNSPLSEENGPPS